MPPRRKPGCASNAVPRHKPKAQAKRQSAATAKAKAAASQAPRAVQAQPTSRADPQQAGRVWRFEEEPTATGRRAQLARTDTDEQVKRASDSHPAGIVSKVGMSAKRGRESGLIIRDYIASEVRSRRKQGNKLGPTCWKDLHLEFDLGVCASLTTFPSPKKMRTRRMRNS